jgi:hypothetical protein
MKNILISCCLSISFLFAAFSCNEPASEDTKEEHGTPSDTIEPSLIDSINSSIESFSSPIETAALLKDAGAPYTAEFSMPIDSIDNLDTQYKKALGLGMLFFDLEYDIVYPEESNISNYLGAVQRISANLKILHFFNIERMTAILKSNENIDSLRFISVQSYHKINDQLRRTEQSHLSALIVTGSWLESLYLMGNISKGYENAKLRDRISNQEKIISLLTETLSFYKDKPYFEKLIGKLNELKSVYKASAEPTDSSVSEEEATIKLTDKQLEQLLLIVSEIRTEVMSRSE